MIARPVFRRLFCDMFRSFMRSKRHDNYALVKKSNFYFLAT